MTSNVPAIIIDNGSSYTKAGFSTDELPTLVFPTNYSENSITKEVVIGDAISNYPENEVYTLTSEGMIYNWNHALKNWEYIYDNLKVESNELPLVITENTWNTKKNKLKTCELVFEKLQVPIFSLAKTPLCVTYGVGRSTGLVVDIGSSVASVTPILDGAILSKSAMHSNYAGDFVDLHVLKFLSGNKDPSFLLPKSFQKIPISTSYKNWKISNYLTDFKSTMTAIADQPPNQYQYQVTPRDYQLPNESYINCGIEQLQLAEPIFQPSAYPLPNVNLPQDASGITSLILQSLKSIDNKGGIDIYQQLLSSIILVGGTSLTDGISQRLLNDLSRFIPGIIPSFYDSTTVEKLFGTWIGASILSSISNNYDSLFITKRDYEENGEEYVLEKFK